MGNSNANPTAIATLLADLQAAFQEYDISLPSNHTMQRMKEERDRALERALRMERERDDALRARDAALKLAEESYGELRALMDSRARRIQEIRDLRTASNNRHLYGSVSSGGERDRDRELSEATIYRPNMPRIALSDMRDISSFELDNNASFFLVIPHDTFPFFFFSLLLFHFERLLRSFTVLLFSSFSMFGTHHNS